ncbi:MAG: Sec-independent protein translocase protein TatB [Pseudomonadota bacterium]
MFDIAPSEFILFALVALVVIGPKDLPKAMRVVGRFVGKARGMARHFRSGFDAMVREAELEEMEKKWKEENERIMREHGALTETVASLPPPQDSRAALAASREKQVPPELLSPGVTPATIDEAVDVASEPTAPSPASPEEKAA